MVECSSNGADSPLDTENGYYMNGASLIAFGSSAMLEKPQSDSLANSILAGVSYSAGTSFTLSDSNSNVILSTTTTKSGGAIILSSPNIKTGRRTR